MANTIRTSITSRAAITNKDIDARFLLTAHRMVEVYCGQDFEYRLATVTYDVDELSEPLPALDDMPINQVVSVVDSQGADQQHIFTDKFIFGTWSSTPITVQYSGGLPNQIFDGIIRQANMLAARTDSPSEITDLGIDGFDPKFNPQFRSGLSPDVKQMVFAYKVVGF